MARARRAEAPSRGIGLRKRAKSKTSTVVFLFDVDNTLLDNDRVQAHLKEHLEKMYGIAARDRYWEILERLRSELGYVDYLGALERFRIDEIHRPDVLRMFQLAGRLSVCRSLVSRRPGCGDACAAVGNHRHPFGRRCRLPAAQSRTVWPLASVRGPCPHDDKLRILAAVKKIWKERVTTVFPKQGHYAFNPSVLAECPPADIELARIGDLLNCDLAVFQKNY